MDDDDRCFGGGPMYWWKADGGGSAIFEVISYREREREREVGRGFMKGFKLSLLCLFA